MDLNETTVREMLGTNPGMTTTEICKVQYSGYTGRMTHEGQRNKILKDMCRFRDKGVVTSEKDPATFGYRWYLQ